MTERYRPRYKWQETWPGESKQDFIGYDGEDVVGRIQLDQTTSNRTGLWRWNGGFQSWVRKRIMPQQGWEETAREASRRAEKHHNKLKAIHGR